MYKYEKIEHNHNLPTKLLYFENFNGKAIGKHCHQSVEILVPLYGNFDLWIDGDIKTITAGKICD